MEVNVERVLLVFEDGPDLASKIEMDPEVQGYTKDGYIITNLICKGGKAFLYLELN